MYCTTRDDDDDDDDACLCDHDHVRNDDDVDRGDSLHRKNGSRVQIVFMYVCVSPH